MQWFDSTSGRVGGVVGLVLAGLMAAAGLAGALPLGWVGLAAVFAWVAWVAMLRPRLGVSSSDLVLRGLVSTTTIPLGRIQRIAVQQVFVAWVGDRRYVSAAVGHSRRQIAKPTRAARGSMHYADAVEDMVRARLRDAVGTAAPVERRWAWVEIGLGVAALVLLVVLILV